MAKDRTGSIKLPPDKIAELMENQRKLNDIILDIDNAEAIGLDVSEFRRLRDQYYAAVSEILARYQ